MKHESRKLTLRRETLAPMLDAGAELAGDLAPPQPAGGPGGLRASSRACIRASAHSIASVATAISTYLITRGC